MTLEKDFPSIVTQEETTNCEYAHIFPYSAGCYQGAQYVLLMCPEGLTYGSTAQGHIIGLGTVTLQRVACGSAEEKEVWSCASNSLVRFYGRPVSLALRTPQADWQQKGHNQASRALRNDVRKSRNGQVSSL